VDDEDDLSAFEKSQVNKIMKEHDTAGSDPNVSSVSEI